MFASLSVRVMKRYTVRPQARSRIPLRVRYAGHAPRGYGHALYCARDFLNDAPFLHLVGDHVYVNRGPDPARLLIQTACENACSVSGVQPTRENLLRSFGAVGATRIPGAAGLFEIERVVEKPTPTEAETNLLVSGLRAGYYLCFFGMHVLMPTVIDLLARRLETEDGPIGLSCDLNELAQRERYLAVQSQGARYAVDTKYGILHAQLALALTGKDRNEVLAGLVDVMAQHEMARNED